YCLFIVCFLPVYCLFIACLLPVYRLFIACLSPVYRLFIACLLPAYCLFVACLLPVCCLFVACLCFSPLCRLFMRCRHVWVSAAGIQQDFTCARHCPAALTAALWRTAHHVAGDRKSTRLNSSHVKISYAV